MFYKQFKVNSQENEIKRSLLLKILETIHYELRWIHANPSIYCDAEGKKILNLYSLCPISYEKLSNNLFSLIVSSNEKIILLVGEKGKGKTTIMNYFLNTKTPDLNERNITWIRIEVTKIYRNLHILCKRIIDRIQYLEEKEEKRKVEIRKEKLANRVYDYLKNYFFAQLIYVWLRYGVKWKTDKVLSSIKEEELLQKLRNMEEFQSEEVWKEFERGWRILKKTIMNEPRFLNSMEHKPIGWKYVRHAGEALLSLLDKNQKKLILFIDGIDNVDYDSTLKEALIKKFGQFVEEIENEIAISKIIIALRPEIKEELVEKFSYLFKYGFIKEKFLMNEPEFPSCVSFVRKLTADCKEELPQYNKNSLDSRSIKILKNILNLNKNEANGSNLESMLKQHLEEVFEPGTNLCVTLKDIYKEHCKTDEERREFIVHLLNIVEHIKKIDSKLTEDIEWFYYHFPRLIIQALIEKKFFSDKELEIKRIIYGLEEKINKLIKEKKLVYEFFYKKTQKNLEKSEELIQKFEELKNALDSLKEIERIVLNLIFNNNRREYLDALWNSYVYIRKYSNSRGIESVKEYISTRKRGKLMLLESIFRNHNYYCPIMETEKSFVPPYISVPFLNLLNPNSLKESSFSPLIPTFILMSIAKEERSKGEIITYVVRTFGNIPETKIDDILDAFLEACYVSYAGNERYKITDKGRFVYEYTFKDINVFSTLAYNGLIEGSFREKLRKYTTISKSENPWEKYVSVTLRNTFLLIAFWENELKKFELGDELKLYDNSELKEDIDYFLQVLFVERVKEISEGNTPVSAIVNTIFGESELDRNLESKLEKVINNMTDKTSVLSFYKLADVYKERTMDLLRLLKHPHDPSTGKVIQIEEDDIYRLFKILSFYKPFRFLSQPEVAIRIPEVRSLLFSGREQMTEEEMKKEIKKKFDNLILPINFKERMINIINYLQSINDSQRL